MKTIFAMLALLPIFVGAHTSEGVQIIHMSEEGFEPSVFEIEIGTEVIFENVGARSHWPASDLHPTHTQYPGSDIRKCDTDEVDNLFDSCKPVKPGETYSFIFNEAGEWGVHDHLSPDLTAQIIVGSDRAIENKNKQIKSPQLTALQKIAFGGYRIYSKVFPNSFEKFAGKKDFYEIVFDDKDLAFWMLLIGYDNVLDELLEDVSTRQDLGEVSPQCHVQGHFVGRMAYRIYGSDIIGNNIDYRCQQGFYHGIIEMFIKDAGIESGLSVAAKKCNEHSYILDRSFCEHAIGHGLLILSDYDLPKAIETCGRFEESTLVEMCWHGVFMENVFAGTGAAIEHNSPWIDPDRAFFPCDELNELYGDEKLSGICYFHQTFYWEKFPDKYGIDEAVKNCSLLAPKVRRDCFTGIGYSAASSLNASTSSQSLVEVCKKMPTNFYERQCLAGALFIRKSVWENSINLSDSTICQAMNVSDLERCSQKAQELFPWIF